MKRVKSLQDTRTHHSKDSNGRLEKFVKEIISFINQFDVVQFLLTEKHSIPGCQKFPTL